jgi:hypothetical protein
MLALRLSDGRFMAPIPMSCFQHWSLSGKHCHKHNTNINSYRDQFRVTKCIAVLMEGTRKSKNGQRRNRAIREMISKIFMTWTTKALAADRAVLSQSPDLPLHSRTTQFRTRTTPRTWPKKLKGTRTLTLTRRNSPTHAEKPSGRLPQSCDSYRYPTVDNCRCVSASVEIAGPRGGVLNTHPIEPHYSSIRTHVTVERRWHSRIVWPAPMQPAWRGLSSANSMGLDENSASHAGGCLRRATKHLARLLLLRARARKQAFA